MLAKTWNMDYHGSHFDRLDFKLAKLRLQLKKFNRDAFGDIIDAYRKATNVVAEIRLKLHQNLMNSSLLSQEKEALNSYAQVSKAYEKFLHQKKQNYLVAFG